MSKFERVLSDDFFDDLGARTAYDNWVGFGRKVEQAVLAKQAEQEPVAIVDYFDGVVGLKKLIDTLPKGMKLYTHPMPNSQGFLDDSNHIADASKMVGSNHVADKRKTLEQHRAEFEAHWHSIQSHGLDNGWLGVAWAAWKAARGITE